MGNSKRERNNLLNGKLMSSNDHVKTWNMKLNKMKENVMTGDYYQLVEEKPKYDRNSKFERLLTKKDAERSKLSESKINAVFVESKSKTFRDSPVVRPETKRFLNSSDKLKKKDSLIFHWQRETMPFIKHIHLNINRHHNKIPKVPSMSITRFGESVEEDKKAKKSQKTKKEKNKLGLGLDRPNKVEVPKHTNQGEFCKNKVKIKRDVPYSSLVRPVRSHHIKRRCSSGKTIVIYQKQNRRKYHRPQAGDGHLFEEVEFKQNRASCVDFVQSKRSLSEPRRNSIKEFFVSRQRTRLHVEPSGLSSTTSDFYSAVDETRNEEVAVKAKKFGGDKNNSEKSVCKKQSEEHEKCRAQKVIWRNSHKSAALKKLKSSLSNQSMEKENIIKRLKQTAEKKLDLHKEMIRAEEKNQKKFRESIQRSLNYRCALADMFSSQSFVSKNESAKFFSSAKNPFQRSTEIFVEKSTFKKISSYQEFHTLWEPKRYKERKSKANTSSIDSSYQKMKSIFDTILINEEEEEENENEYDYEDEEEAAPRTEDSSISQFTTQSSFLPMDTANESNKSVFLPESTSEKLNLMATNLINGDATELEALMDKLSNEIKKCSDFIEKLKCLVEDKKPENHVCLKLSESDSKIELEEGGGGQVKDSTADFQIKSFDYISCFPCIYHQISALSDFSTDNDRRIGKEAKEDVTNACRRFEKKTTEAKSVGHSDDRRSPRWHKECDVSNAPELPSSSSETKAQPSLETKSTKSKEFSCCNECRCLRKRVMKVEIELEKIQKKLPVFPLEYQNSVKNCLERLKDKSETVLEKLKSCASMGLGNRCHRTSQRGGCSKRSTSAPEPQPPVHESDVRPVSFKSSTSDYQLNVGMEITMENVDPITKKKLHPETKGQKQEGNIQCMMFKDDEEPFMVLDTDFTYNPETGMLFAKKKPDKCKIKHATLQSCAEKCHHEVSSTANEADKKQIVISDHRCTIFRDTPFTKEGKKSETLRCSDEETVANMYETSESYFEKDLENWRDDNSEKSSEMTRKNENCKKRLETTWENEDCKNSSDVCWGNDNFEKPLETTRRNKSCKKCLERTWENDNSEKSSEITKTNENCKKCLETTWENDDSKNSLDVCWGNDNFKKPLETTRRNENCNKCLERTREGDNSKKVLESTWENENSKKSSESTWMNDESKKSPYLTWENDNSKKSSEMTCEDLKKYLETSYDSKTLEEDGKGLTTNEAEEDVLWKTEGLRYEVEADGGEDAEPKVSQNSIPGEMKTKSLLSWRSKKKETKNQNPTSRIPTRANKVSYPCKLGGTSASNKSSRVSFAKSETNSTRNQHPCCLDSESRVSCKNPEALIKTNSSDLSRKKSGSKFILKKLKISKSTQTHKKQTQKEPKPKSVKKVDFGNQTTMSVADNAIQATTKNRNEEIQTPHLERADFGVVTSPMNISDLYENDSSSCYLLKPGKTSISLAVQTLPELPRTATASVGLQAELPTQESIKYINDLKIQKKVNVAIAELCFHLNKPKEQPV